MLTHVRIDPGAQHVRGIGVFARYHLVKLQRVGLWEHSHAAVFNVSIVHRQPQRDDLHRLQGPIRSILVHQDFLAVAGWLGDVVGRKESDIFADVVRSDGEQPRVRDQAHPEGIVRDKCMAKVLGAQLRVLLLQPLDVTARLVDQTVIEDVAVDCSEAANVGRQGVSADDDEHEADCGQGGRCCRWR